MKHKGTNNNGSGIVQEKDGEVLEVLGAGHVRKGIETPPSRQVRIQVQPDAQPVL